jgi:hypothetical protein
VDVSAVLPLEVPLESVPVSPEPLPGPGSGCPYWSPAGDPANAVGASAIAASAAQTNATVNRGMRESLNCAPSIKSSS